MLSFEPDGSVLDFAGNYTEFHDWKQSLEPQLTQSKPAETVRNHPAAPDSANASELSKNQRNQLEKRVREIEAEIPSLESQASKLTAEIALPEVAADYGRLSESTAKLTAIEGRIQALYDEWSEVADQLK